MAARWFRVLYAENALRRSLEVPPESLTAATATDALVRFCRDFRGQHVGTDEVVVRWRGSHLTLARHLVRSDGVVGPVEVGFDLEYGVELGAGAVVLANDDRLGSAVRSLEAYRGVVRRRPLGVRVFQDAA